MVQVPLCWVDWNSHRDNIAVVGSPLSTTKFSQSPRSFPVMEGKYRTVSVVNCLIPMELSIQWDSLFSADDFMSNFNLKQF